MTADHTSHSSHTRHATPMTSTNSKINFSYVALRLRPGPALRTLARLTRSVRLLSAYVAIGHVVAWRRFGHNF